MNKKTPVEQFLKDTEFFSDGSYIHEIFETHFHLDLIKSKKPEEVVSSFKSLGISKAMTISTSKENWETCASLSNEFDNLFFSLGTHPHQAKDYELHSTKEIIKKYESNSNFLAVGEIGLDYYYNFSDPESQKKCFIEHLEIAGEINKPVVIHNRESDRDMKNILRTKSNQMKKKGVIHSFSSGIDLAEFALSEGFYLGFNGMCTFKNAENVREAIALCPMDKILLETDSPFLAPTPYRGIENNPCYLPIIALKISEIKNIPLAKTLETCYKNSTDCFGR